MSAYPSPRAAGITIKGQEFNLIKEGYSLQTCYYLFKTCVQILLSVC